MKSHVSKEYDEISETSCIRQSNLTVQCAWPDFQKSQFESLLLRKQQTIMTKAATDYKKINFQKFSHWWANKAWESKFNLDIKKVEVNLG